MRFNGLALCASAIMLAACGGNKDAENAGATTGATTSTVTTPAGPTTGATTAPGATPAAAGTAAAITGTTHEVKMTMVNGQPKFVPENITVKAGDGIKFVNVEGGPHNVAFDPAAVPDDVEGQLDANITDKMGPLTSNMKMNPNETITISFANIKPGTYEFICQPHSAMGMKGKVTVQ
jgi:plastocyanin